MVVEGGHGFIFQHHEEFSLLQPRIKAEVEIGQSLLSVDLQNVIPHMVTLTYAASGR